MSKNYVLNCIYDYIHKFYSIMTNVTKVDDTHYQFDLGNNCAFVLDTTAFKTHADIHAFILELTARMNACLVSA